MSDVTVTKVLDASGLACPMPIVKTRMAIDEIQSGEVLKLISTDRGSCTDVPAWTSSTGHELLEQTEDDGSFIFLIRKA
ncbi:MAG: sulfurtransferase TusA family protein [Nitriliruptorales bacterium]|nr:sulfurtransferase TusA family protein [Nitriliruptorales bacterium]